MTDLAQRSHVVRECPMPTARAMPIGLSGADAGAVALLLGLTALVAWNRFTFDATWLARLDSLTFILPWYAHLGERLRDFDVPGWNPHLFSGTPFAGDPQSGWMYLPAMLVFPLLQVTAAFKAMVVLQLLVAGLSTYAFARVLGMGAAAALVAATVYLFGPFIQWNTYCCTIMAHLATWLPLALLGVELAIRARRWRARVIPWFVTGVAISQILSGWIGQGSIYALLVVASYIGYRALLSPPAAAAGRGLRDRLLVGTTTGIAVLGLGLAFAAAALLPRIAVNAESNLAGGDYEALGVSGADYQPWRLGYLLLRIMGDGYDNRSSAFGGAAIALSLLAPAIARRRLAVPYFVGLTAVALTLTLAATPLHQLFYLLPRFQVLHEHDQWRVLAVAAIGPAMLSGAAVETLPAWRGRLRVLPVVLLPLLVMLGVAYVVTRSETFPGWPPLVAAGVVTALVLVAIAAPRLGRRASEARIARLVPALLLLAVVVEPTGTELSGSWLGWPDDPSWERRWDLDETMAPGLAAEIAPTDPGGAGAFLQARLAEGEPFRYAGYGGVSHPDQVRRASNYLGIRLEPNVQALLVNGRPMFLGLHDIQGYNPIELARYAEFMTALNGRPQNYHFAYLLHTGVRSPLLDLLNVRYVVIDLRLPPEREDVAGLRAGRHEVFRNDRVVVYEREVALPHAWIVHDVRAVARGEALPLLTSGAVDPYATALVEGTAPPVAPAPDSGGESARVTRYEPDRVTIATTAGAPGLLVVSEIYEPGWRAYVDGEAVALLPTHHVLRGVPIPAGTHTVELRYEATALRLGLAITGTTALAFGAAVAVIIWDQRRSRRARAGDGTTPATGR